MKKKFIIATAFALTLAGCSASATAETVETASTATVTVEQSLWKDSSDTKVISTFKETLVQQKLKENTARVNSVVKKLKRRIGKTPYVFAGSTPYGWDCSGMVMWAYGQLGIHLKHSATEQGYVGKRVKTPKVGDIVVFGYRGYKTFYHAAIYIGDGKIINSNIGYGGTVIEPLSHYEGSKIVFRRLIDTL